jgi:hypothetical protein
LPEAICFQLSVDAGFDGEENRYWRALIFCITLNVDPLREARV